VIRLKSGTVVRGSILEIVPGGTVVIRKVNGTVLVYNMEDVARIEKSGVAPQPVPNRQPNRVSAHRQIAGAGLLATWLVTVVAAAAMKDDYISTTAIPVVGPFATISRVERDPFGYFEGGNKGLLITSGMMQTGFLIYLTAAFALRSAPSERL
jgi:hypothetical protein